jgi:cation:H+ antiporter
MILEVLFLIIGIALLVKGADFLVDGATTIADKFGVSALVIGLTVVAFGTSMPELFVNLISALNGNTDIALGNVIGSNIANILLVLGIVAVMKPIKVENSTTWKEIPYSFLATILILILANIAFIDKIQVSFIPRSAGLILLSFFIIFLVYTFGMAMANKKMNSKIKKDDLSIVKRSWMVSLLFILIGIVGLYFGGKWTVDSAVYFANIFGLSQYVISATIIAIGTSLPEVVTGITAARKGNVDLAVGNSIGSNIFNILLILGITAIVAPIIIPSLLNIDILILLGITLLLWVFLLIGKNKKLLGKGEGVIFLLLYAAYIVSLVLRG